MAKALSRLITRAARCQPARARERGRFCRLRCNQAQKSQPATALVLTNQGSWYTCDWSTLAVIAASRPATSQKRLLASANQC